MDKTRALRYRIAPLEMSPGEFRKAGYRLIDQVAELLCTLPDLPGSQEIESYLNALNAELLTQLQKRGEAFLSNAVIGETFVLRACIVNFRTSLEDIEALPGIVIRIGREVDAAIRPGNQKDPERNIR